MTSSFRRSAVVISFDGAVDLLDAGIELVSRA